MIDYKNTAFGKKIIELAEATQFIELQQLVNAFYGHGGIKNGQFSDLSPYDNHRAPATLLAQEGKHEAIDFLLNDNGTTHDSCFDDALAGYALAANIEKMNNLLLQGGSLDTAAYRLATNSDIQSNMKQIDILLKKGACPRMVYRGLYEAGHVARDIDDEVKKKSPFEQDFELIILTQNNNLRTELLNNIKRRIIQYPLGHLTQVEIESLNALKDRIANELRQNNAKEQGAREQASLVNTKQSYFSNHAAEKTDVTTPTSDLK